ncbi:heterokaryon incompatibility protein-domain-containing protein [Xylaria arbuscula]|nr:heterokaryon incompatibility protein-domain-containing protein [Xylaria arbuscula]
MVLKNDSSADIDPVLSGGVESYTQCSSLVESAIPLFCPPLLELSNIRLLSLMPGNFEQELRCEISVHNLSSIPEYQAVSYTWAEETGNVDKCKTILVSSHSVRVTRNCENVLKRIRKSQELRVIWIDAVCINQSDIDERGPQVQLMPQIYRGARGVLVYLGEAAGGSDFCFDALASGRVGEDGYPKFRKALKELVWRPYWLRVWILQEFALARTATVICGD